MARFARIMLRVSILRRVDGLVTGVRVHAPKLADMLFWLDRDTGHMAELRRHQAPGAVSEN